MQIQIQIQIGNPQHRELIPLSQIRNILGKSITHLQIANPEFILFDPQNANPQISLVFLSANCKSANFYHMTS